jgi:hypothetical protein
MLAAESVAADPRRLYTILYPFFAKPDFEIGIGTHEAMICIMQL